MVMKDSTGGMQSALSSEGTDGGFGERRLRCRLTVAMNHDGVLLLLATGADGDLLDVELAIRGA